MLCCLALIRTLVVASLEGFEEVGPQNILNGPSTALDKTHNFSLRSFDLVECEYLSNVNIGEMLSIVSCRLGVHGGVVIHG